MHHNPKAAKALMLERKEKKESSSGMINWAALAWLPSIRRISLSYDSNWTAGGPDKFPYGSLAPTSKRGHSLHGECWQILTFLSVLKLETFLENNYLPFIILGR